MTSSNSVPTTAAIIAGFPYPTLSAAVLDGDTEPSFASLEILQRELNDNAMSSSSTRGDGLHGHLVLTMPPAAYAAMEGHIAFIIPPNPGAAAVIPDNATQAQIGALERTFTQQLRDFQSYRNTDHALKQVLIAAVPDIFIRAKRNLTFGYANVTTLDLLTHLHATYGEIMPEDIMAKQNAINIPWWSPPTPVEDLFAKLEDASTYLASANAPVPEVVLVQAVYQNFLACGLFESYCHKWRDKSPAARTWPQARLFFTKASNDRRLTTAAAAGYHAVHAVLQPLSANTANATASTELASYITRLDKLQKKFDKLSAKMSSTPSSTLNYCWTHGTTSNPNHTSMTCKNKRDGHQDHATLINKLGGSDRVYTEADRRPRSTPSTIE
jgi:hypothetical protein